MTDQPSELNPAALHGYARRPSGLIVPTDVARTREVWVHSETKLLRRLSKLLASHGVTAVLCCDEPACRDHPAIKSELDAWGREVLVCGCKRRELQ